MNGWAMSLRLADTPAPVKRVNCESYRMLRPLANHVDKAAQLPSFRRANSLVWSRPLTCPYRYHDACGSRSLWVKGQMGDRALFPSALLYGSSCVSKTQSSSFSSTFDGSGLNSGSENMNTGSS